MRFERQHLLGVESRFKAAVVKFARPQDREVGRGFARAQRVPAGQVVGDVIGVDVGPVEAEVDFGDRLLEALGADDEGRVVELGEPDRGVRLVEVGGAVGREGDRLALDRAAGVHDAVDRAVDSQFFGPGRRHVGRIRGPGVRSFELFHRQALALVEVVHFVLAEHLGERVRVIRFAAGGAPGVIATVAELHVVVDAREGGPARVDPGAVQVLLEQDLGREVPDLRAHHRERVPVRGVQSVDELPVGLVPGLAQEARADRAVHGDRLRARRVRDPRAPGRQPHRAQSRAGLRGGRPGRTHRFAVVHEAHRAGVGKCEAPLGEGGVGFVFVGRRDGRWSLGIVGLAEVLPRRAPGFSAQLLFKCLERKRGAHFAAPALAEQAADQGRLGDHVGELPFFGHFSKCGVLGRH